ncbi:ABC transporter permease [Peptoniphilus duerdenii]|uniref:ABC transporter permease n=1 Tax=Peptoniphilus duerdenii TaxID=507750 RepID=UPI0028895F21|nr:ABC transporter permease [Peptoniphilus duerdenii]
MSRYLKAELFRIRKSRGAIISIILIPLFLIINLGIGFRSGNVVVETNQPIGADFTLIMSEMLVAFIPFVLAIPIYSTVNKETTEHGIKKALESGISPASIYITKFINIILVGILYALLMSIVISLVVLSLGYSFSECLNIFKTIIRVISINFVPIMSLISVYLFLLFCFRNEIITLISYFVIMGPINEIMTLIEKLTKIKNLRVIAEYVPSKLMMKLPTVFNFKETATLFGKELAAIPTVYILCTIYTIVLVGLGITIFSKRKVEGI